MYATYEDACEATISREQMWRECARHGLDPRDLVSDLGDHDNYSGKAILDWLGY